MRFEPRLKVVPAVDNAPPELAIDGPIPAQAQFCERTRSKPQKFGGLQSGQRDRIAGHLLSLTTNHPESPAVSPPMSSKGVAHVLLRATRRIRDEALQGRTSKSAEET
jgi:hypothetical protein